MRCNMLSDLVVLLISACCAQSQAEVLLISCGESMNGTDCEIKVQLHQSLNFQKTLTAHKNEI